MRKLAVISDLHVDINRLGEKELGLLVEVLQAQTITHVHLAGDVANKLERVLHTVAFIEAHGIPVTYNFGNHEMPSLKTEQEIEQYPESHFLNQQTIRLNEDTVLLAFNGWYDYSYALEKDHKKILAAKNLYWYDRFIHREHDDVRTQHIILEQLAGVLDYLQACGKQVIIATHFVPKREFIVYQKGKYERWNQLNAFLGSARTGELFDRYDHIKQVVFGHTHRRFSDQVLNGTRYSCHPFGYYFEWQLTREFVLGHYLMDSFNPMKVRGVLKNYQPAFEAYRNDHLKDEFIKGMTLITY